MNITAYRDGRLVPRLKLWGWMSDHKPHFVLALWALGWSVQVSNVGVGK